MEGLTSRQCVLGERRRAVVASDSRQGPGPAGLTYGRAGGFETTGDGQRPNPPSQCPGRQRSRATGGLEQPVRSRSILSLNGVYPCLRPPLESEGDTKSGFARLKGDLLTAGQQARPVRHQVKVEEALDGMPVLVTAGNTQQPDHLGLRGGRTRRGGRPVTNSVCYAQAQDFVTHGPDGAETSPDGAVAPPGHEEALQVGDHILVRRCAGDLTEEIRHDSLVLAAG